MGTRNLTCVVADGAYRVAQYCQWDGYPSGQGKTVLEFCRTMNRGAFKRKVLACNAIDQAEVSRRYKEIGADDSGWVDMAIAEKFKKAWPQLDRDMGAKVLNAISMAPDGFDIHLDVGFAADSLFCEWCYVIDLDKATLEVFGGFNKKPLPAHERFAGLVDHGNKTADGNQYYPVRLLKTWSLNKLPTYEDFHKALDEAAEAEQPAA